MNELLEELESVLIESGNPILQYMDDDIADLPHLKSKEWILEYFSNQDLECYSELLELYLWKVGCGPELYIDYSEMTGEEFFIRLTTFGNYISFIDSTSMFCQNIITNDSFSDVGMVPFIINGYTEYPIFLDMNPQSDTYKSLCLYCPQVTKSEKPVMMYDSLGSWMRTIIQCYKQKIYHIDERGALITDINAEYILSKKMNPKSPYWKIYV